MSRSLEVLPWDCAFFGHTIARAELAYFGRAEMLEVMAWCDAEGVDLLYLLCPSDHGVGVRALQDQGFELVDVRVTLGRDRIPCPVKGGDTIPSNGDADEEVVAGAPPSGLVRVARPEDLVYLRPIAAQAHTDSRFYYDSRLRRAQADALFERWIEASCLEGFADRVLVAELEGSAQAYITGSVSYEGQGEIGLVGVGEQARGRGLGSTLVETMSRWLLSQGAEGVRVVTQARNVAAQRLYQRCGFLTETVELWYHRWFDR